jgi:predicted AAA+ superfamily ATPase
LSYQVLTLPPWFRNPEKRLQKRPKVHMVDPGILRSVTGRRGPLTGAVYESAVVPEMYKEIRTQRLPWRRYHLRTQDGREVDLLLEGEHGFIAIEIKASDRVDGPEARRLVDVEALLDRPLLGKWVVSEDADLRALKPGVLALPAAWLLAP